MRATSRLSAAHAAAPPGPLPWRDLSGRNERPPRVVLPGAGHWAWWGWALYVLLLGPPLVLGLAGAAALRVVLPTGHRVWAFRRRRTALAYLATLAVLAGGAAAAAAGTIGWPATALTHLLAAPGPAPAASAGAGAPLRPDGGTHLAAPTPTPAPTAGTAVGEAVTIPASAVMAAPPAAGAGPGPEPRRVAVGGTGGQGVALRRSPRWADRWPGVAWPDRTALVVLVDGLTGDDGAGGATPWLRVRDPAGNEGFVPGRYTAALP